MLAFNKIMPAGIHNNQFSSIVQELQKAFVFFLIAIKQKVELFCFVLNYRGSEGQRIKW